MYNRLKTMVNQVRNLRSTKWDDHEMVKGILRSLVFRNPTQVQLIRGDLRYKQMSPEEVIDKFVSFELLIKDSKHIVNLEQGATSTPEVQPKATKEKKEESTPTNRLPIDASKLDNDEMTLIIKSFWQILKQRKGRTTNLAPRGFATGVVSPVTILLIVHIQVIVTGRRQEREEEDGEEKNTTTRRRVARCTWDRNRTPTRAPSTPPLRKMPPTSPSTKVFSSPTSATNVSWPRIAKRRRYILEIPPNIQLPMMREDLVTKMMICTPFLQTLP
jgi:hypothetical protein